MAKQIKTAVDGNKPSSLCPLCGNPVEVSGSYRKWCPACEDRMAQFLIYNLNQAGKLGEAEKTLTGLLNHQQTPILQYYLGLVRAQTGNLDGSIELLNSLTESLKEKQEYRRTFSRILASRAAHRVIQKNYHAAVDDLALSIEMSPGDSIIERSLSLAKSIDAILQSGKSTDIETLEKLIQTFQQIQKMQPENYIITHNLAVLSYQRASEAEKENKSKIADAAWRITIANWSMLFNSEIFWIQWAEREKTSYELSATIEDIKALRIGVENRLLQDFRDYRTQYGGANDTKAARRHREYEVLFKLETKTAEAMQQMAEIFRQKNVSSPISVYCGPMMLENLGMIALAQEMLSQARNHNLSASRVLELESYLSPSGRIKILIKINWLEEAESELDVLLTKFPSDAGFRSQMVEVLIGLANQLASNEKFDDAVKKLEKGFKYANNRQSLQELTAKIFLDEARRIGDSVPHADAINKVIKLLEKGRKLSPDNAVLAQEMATFYAERAISSGNQARWEDARIDIRNALNNDKNNGRALRNAEIIYNNRAVELGNAGQLSEAIEVVKEGLQYLDSNDLRKLLERLRQARG